MPLDSILLSRFGNALPNFKRLRQANPDIKMDGVFLPDSLTSSASIYAGLSPAKHGILNFIDPLDRVTTIVTEETDNSELGGKPSGTSPIEQRVISSETVSIRENGIIDKGLRADIIMQDKLKVGIVGCGAIAGMRHIPAFMRLKGKVALQALCDINEGLAKDIAHKYHIPGVYSQFSQMLSREKLDIADICTPPQTHAPLTVEAIESGCHVIVEKPMALKTSDCDKMVNASSKHGVKLCVIHNQLFYPPVIEVRRLVAGGAIGDFIGMRIFMSDPRDEMIMREDYWIHKLPGGLIGETGPHAVYKSLAFIGKVREVDIRARKFLDHPWAPFDEFRIELEGERGNSSILISYSSNRKASSIDLLGTEGAFHLDLRGMLLIYQGKSQSVRPVALARSSLGTASQIIGSVARNAFNVLTGKGRFLGHDTVIEGFINSILNNHQPPVTGEEGRETTRVLEMIVETLREKYSVF